MNNFNTYFSTLIITYLLEAYALRKISVVNEHELILNITSMVSIMGTKDNIAIPAQNKQLYAEMINKNSGTMMIVLDELVNATYIICNKGSYMINFEHDYIKKFIASHGSALKYVSHTSYSLKRNVSQLYNDENSLCMAIEKMKLSSEAPLTTPINSKIQNNNSGPELKKKKVEENTNLVEKLDKAFAEVEETNKIYYVKSENNPKVKYIVTSTSCSCPTFTYGKGKPCKHMNNIDFFESVQKNVDNSEMIKNIYSIQSDSDVDKFYNLYLHTNEKYSCSCPSYKYQCAKTNSHCKHIDSFLSNYYQKYDKFTLVNKFEKNNNKPIFIKK